MNRRQILLVAVGEVEVGIAFSPLFLAQVDAVLE
jgi:hypothetical protein